MLQVRSVFFHPSKESAFRQPMANPLVLDYRKPIFIFCIHEGRKNIHQTITIYIHIFGATYNAKYTHCKIIQVMVNLKTGLITTSFTED